HPRLGRQQVLSDLRLYVPWVPVPPGLHSYSGVAAALPCPVLRCPGFFRGLPALVSGHGLLLSSGPDIAQPGLVDALLVRGSAPTVRAAFQGASHSISIHCGSRLLLPALHDPDVASAAFGLAIVALLGGFSQDVAAHLVLWLHAPAPCVVVRLLSGATDFQGSVCHMEFDDAWT
ncbi:unnamed protein product, partial [Polarella glacialis]